LCAAGARASSAAGIAGELAPELDRFLRIEPSSHRGRNQRRAGAEAWHVDACASGRHPEVVCKEKRVVTSVGTESTLIDLVRDLIKLDHAAIEAYNFAISKLSSEEYKRNLAAFRDDHIQHTDILGAWMREQRDAPPEGGGVKEVLTTGKGAVASVTGDRKILQAMKSSEDDTNIAYERAANHEGADELLEVFEKNLSDERRHRRWIESVLQTLELT
jgi:rubrerythrin